VVELVVVRVLRVVVRVVVNLVEDRVVVVLSDDA